MLIKNPNMMMMMMNTISVKQFGSKPGLTLCNIGPDLGTNCLQRLSADDKKSLLARKELVLVTC